MKVCNLLRYLIDRWLKKKAFSFIFKVFGSNSTIRKVFQVHHNSLTDRRILIYAQMSTCNYARKEAILLYREILFIDKITFHNAFFTLILHHSPYFVNFSFSFFIYLVFKNCYKVIVKITFLKPK